MTTKTTFRYFKIGAVFVKAEYNAIGIRATYVWDESVKSFQIDNTFISEIITGEDVTEMTQAEFEKSL